MPTFGAGVFAKRDPNLAIGERGAIGGNQPSAFGLPMSVLPTHPATGQGVLAQAVAQLAPSPPAAPGGVLMNAIAPRAPANDVGFGPMRSAISSDAPLPMSRPGPMAPDAPIDLSNAQAKKPGFFHHGGLGEKILHTIGEIGLRYSVGKGDPYATMVLRQRFERQQQQVRLLEQVRQRQSERDEWTWRENWKREHPDDQFTQYMRAAGIDPGSPQGQALYRQRAESIAAPPLMAVDGFDAQGNPNKTFVPRTGFSGTGGQAAPSGPALGTVKNGYRFNGGNPNDRNSWVPVGGASPAGGATFR